jgi:hypothetical protein
VVETLPDMRRSSIGWPGEVSGGVTGSTEADEGEVDPAREVRESLTRFNPFGPAWIWPPPDEGLLCMADKGAYWCVNTPFGIAG